MERTKHIGVNEPEVESLLDAIESVPKEKQPIMAVLAKTFINGMKAQEQLSRQIVPPGA